jgi:hypothetical protein
LAHAWARQTSSRVWVAMVAAVLVSEVTTRSTRPADGVADQLAGSGDSATTARIENEAVSKEVGR